MKFLSRRRLLNHQRARAVGMGEPLRKRSHETHLDDPHRCLLLTPDYPLRPDDPSLRVYRTVDCIDCLDMRTMRVWVLVPHSDDDVRP